MSRRLLQFAVKVRVRIIGRANGLSRSDVNTVVDGISDADDFATICDHYEQTTGKKLPTEEEMKVGGEKVEGAVTDFLQWLIQWMSSPNGMAFIKFILSLFGFAIP